MKTLVITGGSKGIGRAAAELFQSNGFRVINLSRSPCPVQGVVQITGDVEALDWPERLGAQLLEAVGEIDRLCIVHNAGLLMKDSIFDLEAESFHRALQVNVVASQQLNSLLLPRMRAGSSILYVGSTLSEKAVANSMSYVVAKHAVIGLMRSSCQDLVGRQIHTACVCPGFTDTEMLRAHVGGADSTLQGIAAGVAFGRLIDPSEIAQTLWFCANSPVVNGTVLHANLGQIEH